MKKAGGKILLLAGFSLLVFLANSFASVEATTPSSVGEVATSPKQLQSVTVRGRLIGRKLSRDGHSWVYLLEGSDGSQCSAFISSDVKPVILLIGDKIQIIGSTLGQG